MTVASTARPETVDELGVELVREWVPAGEPEARIVLVHGISEHSGRYERTGALLAAAGFHVRGFDLYGCGGTGGRRGDVDRWERYHDQIQRHLEWARGHPQPVVLFGHSMGGNLALGYVLSRRPQPDLLVVSAPALGGGAGWQKALAGVVARLAPSVPIPSGIKGEQLSRNPEVGEAYFADPLVYPKATPRLGKALFDAMDQVREACMAGLAVPTLALHGGDDTVVPPQSTAFLVEVPNVERRLLPGLRHEILNEPEGPEVVAQIVDWIRARI